jgi:hypothetical protein
MGSEVTLANTTNFWKEKLIALLCKIYIHFKCLFLYFFWGGGGRGHENVGHFFADVVRL